jgi:hypothetical protein
MADTGGQELLFILRILPEDVFLRTAPGIVQPSAAESVQRCSQAALWCANLGVCSKREFAAKVFAWLMLAGISLAGGAQRKACPTISIS